MRTLPGMDGAALYGWTASEIATRTGASLTTARRWKRARELPPTIATLLRLALFGELELIAGRAWRAWSLERDGRLHGPDGFSFAAAEILSLPFFIHALAAARTRERVALQADFIDQRYVEARADTPAGSSPGDSTRRDRSIPGRR